MADLVNLLPVVQKFFECDLDTATPIPILTTVTDGLGFLAFLGFAVLFQNARIA